VTVVRPQSTHFGENNLDDFRMPSNRRQQDSRGCVRMDPGLLPVAQGGRRKSGLRRKLRLAETHPLTHVPHISVRHCIRVTRARSF
jgi:hypothetical protein